MANPLVTFAFRKTALRLDDTRVEQWLERRQVRALNIIGGTIRKIARQSIRKARKDKVEYIHKQTNERLSKKQGERGVREGWAFRQYRKRKNTGKQPRWRERGQCSLKDGIFYGVEPGDLAVSVGPIKCKNKGQGGRRTVPEALEFGSSENRPFPFMEPALRRALELDKVRQAVEQT